jgi:hypothetical protein
MAKYSIWSTKFKKTAANQCLLLLYIDFIECVLTAAKLQNQLVELERILCKNSQELSKKEQHCLCIDQQNISAKKDAVSQEISMLLQIQSDLSALHDIQQTQKEKRRALANNAMLVNTLKTMGEEQMDLKRNDEDDNEIIFENYQIDSPEACGCFLMPNY